MDNLAKSKYCNRIRDINDLLTSSNKKGDVKQAIDFLKNAYDVESDSEHDKDDQNDLQSPDLINFGDNDSDDEVVVVEPEDNLIKKFEEIDLINFDEKDDIIGSDNDNDNDNDSDSDSRDGDKDTESCHDIESDYDDEENYKDKLKRLSLEGYDPNAERIRQISMTHNSKAPIQIHVQFANATKNV